MERYKGGGVMDILNPKCVGKSEYEMKKEEILKTGIGRKMEE